MTDLRSWTRTQETLFRSAFGTFRLRAYEFPGRQECAALVAGAVSEALSPLVRIQSSCLTGTAFGAVLCDCRAQLEESLQRIAEEGCGCVIYLPQEGRGHGLVEKVRQLSLITTGVANTANAAGEGQSADLRSYDAAFVILGDLLGDSRTMRLMTNNPTKINAFEEAGYSIQRVALETPPTDDNREYLRVKKEWMGHLLTAV